MINPNSSQKRTSGFELLEHTADAGVRARGATLEELFSSAAGGLYALSLGGAWPEPREELAFSISGQTREELLVRFLEELIFLLDTRSLAAASLSVRCAEKNRLEVSGLFGRVEPADRLREVKSPTYHQLHIRRRDGVWETEIYFDL